MLHINRDEADQLRQLYSAGKPGVAAGELISKRVTRSLVRARWAENNGKDASSLSVVRINTAGRKALAYYDDQP